MKLNIPESGATLGMLSPYGYSQLTHYSVDHIDDLEHAKSILRELLNNVTPHTLADRYIHVPNTDNQVITRACSKKYQCAGDFQPLEGFVFSSHANEDVGSGKVWLTVWYVDDDLNGRYYAYLNHYDRFYSAENFHELMLLVNSIKEFLLDEQAKQKQKEPTSTPKVKGMNGEKGHSPRGNHLRAASNG